MNSGAQRPSETSAVDVTIVPWSVSTARTRPPAMSMPVARVEPMNVAPRASARSCSAWQMLAPLAMPSLGT